MQRALLLVLVACGSTSVAPPPAPAKPPPPPPAPPPPDPYAALNLGFERVTDGHPDGWGSGQAAASWGADDAAHGGAHSLRIRPIEDTGFVAVGRSFEVAAARGKHVRLHGWIRTEGVTRGAALWVRADHAGGSPTLDNMGGAAPHGTTPWQEATAEIDVDDKATGVVLGAFVAGGGTAWFDDLRIEIGPVEPPHPIKLEGSVVTASGEPAAGAEVALVAASAVEAHVKADAAGRFSFHTRAGTWGFSATTASASGFIDSARFAKDTAGIALRIAGGVTVHGRTATRPLDGTFVGLSMPSEHDADMFVVLVAADGAFTTQLPRGASYSAEILERGVGSVSVPVAGDAVDLTVPYGPLAPAPEEVIAWIGEHAFRPATTDPGHDLEDLAPLARLVGKAPVVALGEATHGTREFFQMKHRVLQFLVEKLGFTVFAIEANQPECRAIDDYVIGGKGDAKQALAGIYFWTWNTEEVLAMIEWMRAYNADPKHAAKVHFAGFDMQTSSVAHANVVGYLAEVGADAQLAAPLAPLAARDSQRSVGQLTPDERAKIAAGIAALARAFDANQRAWSAKHTTLPYDDARHDLTILDQALQQYTARQDGVFAIRDRSMADNVDWLRRHRPKGTRMMLWAHNGHIANTLTMFANMGGHLRKRYGKDYVNIGFVFSDGSFQAIDRSGQGGAGLREITVGRPPDTDGSAAFTAVGAPLLALDLHAVPATGPVHDWFAQAHPFRDVGAVFVSERAMASPMTLSDLYDAVIFVAHTTRARPVR